MLDPKSCPNCDFGRKQCLSPGMCEWTDTPGLGMDEIDAMGTLVVCILWISMMALVLVIGITVSDFFL